MKRVLLPIAAAALAAAILPLTGDATGPFDTRLSPEQQIIQALNRLTFGPRPGQMEEVRRIGLNKWIELQLHPNQIPENPVLEAKLAPLESLRMNLAEVAKEYAPDRQMMTAMTQPFQQINTLLSDEQRRKVMTGTAEERTEVLKALDPEKRKQVLAGLPPNVIAYTPAFKQEAEEAVKARQEEARKESRRRNPQLADLLDPYQMVAAMSDDAEKLKALLASLDEEKRVQVAFLLPPKRLAELPELRRESQRRRQPRLVASEDLKEARVFRAIYSNRQLEEVLVDFWFNHFNVDIDEERGTGREFAKSGSRADREL